MLDRRVKPPKPEVDPGFEDTDNEEPEIETDKDISVIVDDSEATIIPGFADQTIKDNLKPNKDPDKPTDKN